MAWGPTVPMVASSRSEAAIRGAVEGGAVDRDGEFPGGGVAVVADRQVPADRDLLLDDGGKPGAPGFALAGAPACLLEAQELILEGAVAAPGAEAERRAEAAQHQCDDHDPPRDQARRPPWQRCHCRRVGARVIASSTPRAAAFGPYCHGNSGQPPPGLRASGQIAPAAGGGRRRASRLSRACDPASRSAPRFPVSVAGIARGIASTGASPGMVPHPRLLSLPRPPSLSWLRHRHLSWHRGAEMVGSTWRWRRLRRRRRAWPAPGRAA